MPKRRSRYADTETRRSQWQRVVSVIKKTGRFGEYKHALDWLDGMMSDPLWDSAEEMMVACEFKRRGYDVQPQFPIGRHYYDLYIPVLDLIVEVDGEIYHFMPKNQRLDFEKAHKALKVGHKLVRIPTMQVHYRLRDSVARAIRAANAGLSDFDGYDVLRNVEVEEERTHQEPTAGYVMWWDADTKGLEEHLTCLSPFGMGWYLAR